MMVSKASFFSVFLCFALSGLFPVRICPQESILSSYERNFIRASLSSKPGVLRDAATDEQSGDFIGELCELALRFALDNGNRFPEDPDMIALVGAAARGAGSGGNAASVKSLWELFQVYRDSYSRVEILGALAVLGKGNAGLVENLNRFLETQNDSFLQGLSPDLPVLAACVSALGKLGDASSFPALFSAAIKAYPEALVREAREALESIEGDYEGYLLEIIRRNPFPEKAAAFRMGAYNGKFDPAARGGIAQAALEAVINLAGEAEDSLRYEAVALLARLRWSPAAPLAVRNFYRVQMDYTGGSAPKERFLEAIACLGVMGSSEAARALALQLGYFNSRTEKSGEYDEAVVLALVDALGELGDKAAFDNLLYVSYLGYSEEIQASAREALNRLKW